MQSTVIQTEIIILYYNIKIKKTYTVNILQIQIKS